MNPRGYATGFGITGRYGQRACAKAIRAAADLFEASALIDGEECSIHLRVAESGGRLYLDLCSHAWRAVEIDYGGWRIDDQRRPGSAAHAARGRCPNPSAR